MVNGFSLPLNALLCGLCSLSFFVHSILKSMILDASKSWLALLSLSACGLNFRVNGDFLLGL
jgi:hypothetical protein